MFVLSAVRYSDYLTLAGAVMEPVRKQSSSKRDALAGMMKAAAGSKSAAVAVPDCATCGCSDFAKHPFKQGYCNECFHNHQA